MSSAIKMKNSLNYHITYSLLGAFLFPCFAFINLYNTELSDNFFRYIVPLLLGAVSGFLIGKMKIRWILRTGELTNELKSRKSIEKKLIKKQQQYKTLVETARAVAWELDLKSLKFTYISPRVYDLTGYHVKEWKDFEFWAGTLHPGDRDDSVNFCQNETEKGEDHDFEYRMITAEGKTIWIHDLVTVIKKDGESTGLSGFFIDITQRKIDEEELKGIFLVAPIGIGLVKNRILFQFNEHLCEMVGYSKDELTGQNARILYPADEDYEYVGKEKYRQIEKYGTGTVETRFKHKNGKIIDILLSSTPLDPASLSSGITFTALDISEQKQNEHDTQILVESMIGFIGQELFDNTVVRLCKWLDCDCAIIGEIVSDNKVKAISMVLDDEPVYNYSYTLKGSPCEATIRECYCEYPENVCTLFPDDSDLVEMEAEGYVGAVLEDRNGKAIGILCVISRNRIQTAKHTKKIMKIIADRLSAEIERKKLREEKHKLESQLHQAQKMESIGTLAGGIAHDFNNILFPIVGYSEMLLESAHKESPFRKGLSQIHTGAIRASELVKQILTFASQESGELKLMKMQPIIKEALKLIRSTIPTTIEIKQNLQSDCGAIKADPTQIHQIIMNLATNAYHAMEETGGQLSIRLEKIELEEPDLFNPDLKPGAYACLSVSDTGKGMDKKLILKIFDPFFTTKETGKGTGMGLSVVHGIVKNLNGTVKACSEPDKGSEFHIYLPLVKAVQEQQINDVAVSIPGGSEHILLVDDEKTIIEMEKEMLEHLGYKVTSHSSSMEALEAFRTSPDKFDMVITDMAMPNMSGEKLSARVNAIRPGIPILLCTGFSEIMSEEKAKLIGIKGFLLKPIVRKNLSQKIREILDKNRP